MKLLFQGGNEIVKLDIDRENKILHISSSLTGYAKKRVPYWKLFDKGKERIQEQLTDKLDDEQFRLAIVASMAQNGYVVKDGTI